MNVDSQYNYIRGYEERQVVVVKIAVPICVMLIACWAGCSEGPAPAATPDTRRIDTPAGMVEYLKGENLPALKNVSFDPSTLFFQKETERER